MEALRATRSQLDLFEARESPVSWPSLQLWKSRAKALAASTPPKLRLGYAQSFVATVVSHYWTQLAPRPLRSLPPLPEVSPCRLDREALTLATAMAELGATLAIEEASYFIGSTYAAMLPDDHRSAHGVFYTPPAVVARLLNSASSAGVDWERCRVLDPACGGGAFLAPVARRMLASLSGCDSRIALRNLANRLVGYELDGFAAWLSLVFLNAMLNEVVGIAGDDSLSPIVVCDSLVRYEPEAFDLVIGNPPYGRITLSPELRGVYQRSLFGHANLYGIFLDLALRKVRPGGVVAYVTPTSFLSGEYYKRLRSLLAEEVSPCAFDFVSERSGVFDDVLQETLLTVFRRGASRGCAKVSFVEVDDSDVIVSAAEPVTLPPPQPDQPWIMPRDRSAARTAARLGAMPTRLVDWGYCVRTGPLVWNRFKDRLRERPERGTVPLIWAEAVGADGVFAFRAARRNHAPYFLVNGEEDFLLVRSPCVLLQRTTAKEQAHRLIAAELPKAFLDQHAAVTVENHLNMLVPLVPEPAVDTATLAAFLNSSAADRVFRCISGTVAVSAYELEAMPLPPAAALSGVRRLVQRSASRGLLEQACDHLYGDR